MNIKAKSLKPVALLGVLITVGYLVTGAIFGFRLPSIFGQSYLDAVRDAGELVVVTRNNPAKFHEDKDGILGLEYDLLASFAQQLGVSVRFIVKDTVSEIFGTMERGEAILAAVGLPQSSINSSAFLLGPAYQKIFQQVVCRRDGSAPASVNDLNRFELWVPAQSDVIARLGELRRELPLLRWRQSNDDDSELLRKVAMGEIDCTIADSNLVVTNQRYYPQLAVAFDLGKPDAHSWLLPKEADDLQRELGVWFYRARAEGELDRILARYHGKVGMFDYVDTIRFKRHRQTRLPEFVDIFKTAATRYDIPWTLLAAQAYQESQWDSRASSPTGVRGIMMLTLTTAQDLGVKSRLSAKQSIMGGARYLSNLRAQLPQQIREPDRTWMALAAYNVGLGHVLDAREIARKMGRDPDKWSGISEVLPLLKHEDYYQSTQYGYARGDEPVTYVERVRDYWDILEQSEQRETKPQQAMLVDAN